MKKGTKIAMLIGGLVGTAAGVVALIKKGKDAEEGYDYEEYEEDSEEEESEEE